MRNSLLLSFLQDTRFALRQLRRSPVFAITAILLMTLGIGVGAAMYSVLRATLLQSLPYQRPGELAAIRVSNNKRSGIEPLYVDMKVWRQRSRTFDRIAYYNNGTGYLQTPAGESFVANAKVSASLFPLLGVSPQLGTGLFAADQQGDGKVVILSDDVWRTRFHADPDLIGKSVRIDGLPYTVRGIMPRAFAFPAARTLPQIWTPATLEPAHLKRDYDGLGVSVIGRLHPGHTVAEAQTELSAIQQSLRPFYKSEIADLLAPNGVQVEPLRSSLYTTSRLALLAVTGAVAMLWLIASASTAGLMLSRVTSRTHEIAVRRALGAGRPRLLRQFLAESLLLASIACGFGSLLATLLLHLAQRVLLQQLQVGSALALSPLALGLLVGLTVVSVLLFSVVPVLFHSDAAPNRSLQLNSTHVSAPRFQRLLQRFIVVLELTLTLTLLTACGALLRTIAALHHVPLGFRTDHVLIAEPKLPQFRYTGRDLNREIYQPLFRRVKHLPGVRDAAFSTVLPLSGSFDTTLNLYLTRNGSHAPLSIEAKMRASSPELRFVLGFSVLQGRWFEPADTPTTPLVAVVNRAFADAFNVGGGDLSHFTLGVGKNRKVHIVGVVSDFHQVGVAEAAAPEIDFNAAQLLPTDAFYQATMLSHVEFALRTQADPRSVEAGLLPLLHDVDPTLTASEIRTMDQVVNDAIGPQLLLTHILAGFATLAFVIAIIGLYSLLSYTVLARTSELGLRFALGAQRKNVLALILRQAGLLLFLGLACGIAASLASLHVLQHFLFDKHTHNLFPLSIACIVLLATGVLASLLPARRASQIEPMQALRAE